MTVLKIDELAKKFNIDTTVKAETTPDYDIEVGKQGYQKYLDDQSAKATERQTNRYLEQQVNRSETHGKEIVDAFTNIFGISPKNSDQERVIALESKNPQAPNDNWTEEQKNIFGYKYLSNPDEAYRYAIKTNNAINQNIKEKDLEKIEESATSNIGSMIGQTATSVLLAPIHLTDYAVMLGEKVKYGDIITKPYASLSEYSSTVQKSIGTKLNQDGGTINEKVPILGGKGWGDVYGLGTSIAQSALAAATGSQAFTLTTFFGMSASQGVTDAISRGVDSDKALLYGTVAGLAEAIPEMISVSKLLKIGSADSMTSLFKSVLKQSGEEAEEEAITSVLTAIADGIIMGDKSNFNALVSYYVSQGMTQEQAEKKALTQTMEEIAFDTIAGAASGAFSAGGRAGALTAYDRLGFTKTNRTAKAELGGKTAEMLEAGSEVKEAGARRVIDKYGAKVARGKELSGFELRNLNSKIAEGTEADARAKVKEAIKQRLTALGENAKNVEGLSNLILKKALGEELSVVQNIRLKNSVLGTKVANEIDAANMRSGNFDSSWAKESGVEALRKVGTSGTQITSSAANNEASPANVSGTYQNAAKPQYKVNMDSVRGKIDLEGNYADKIKFKKSSSESKIHTDDIRTSLTREDITNLTAIEKVANALGIDIYVYETTKQSDGTRRFSSRDGSETSANGWYDSSDGSIHIDLRAGQNGKGTMLFTAAHELTHFIKEKSPENFEALERIVAEGFTKKGLSIDALIDKQIEKAKNDGREISREDAREEMIADACETMLADGSLIKKLSALKTENKGLWSAIKRFFDNLFSKIDKLYRNLKPDSAEGKYIADMRKTAKKLKAAFAEGLTAVSEKTAAKTKKTASESTVRSSGRNYDSPITQTDVQVLREIGKKSVNDFTESDIENSQKWARKFYKELGVKSPFFRAWFGDWRAFESNPIKSIAITNINIDTALANMPTGMFSNEDAGWTISVGNVGKNDTVSHAGREKISVRMLSEIKSIIGNAVLLDTEISVKDSSKKHNETTFMHKLYAPVTYNGQQYIAKVTVEEYGAKAEGRRFYNLRGIKIDLAGGIPDANTSYDTVPDTRSINSISDLHRFVKQFDKEFSPKPVNSLLLNEDGTPKMFYHGTRKENGDFYIFDYSQAKRKGGLGFKALGQGNYFTSIELDGTELYGSRVIPAYLKISNPFVVESSSNFDFKKRVSEEIGINASEMSYPSIQKAMREKGYDGVLQIEGDGKPVIAVAFDSEQIKSATENIGTFSKYNPDIRYSSRSNMSTGQINKLKANYTHEKVYSKKLAFDIISRFSSTGDFKAKTREAIAESLWEGLNGCTSIEERNTFAHDTAVFVVGKMLSESRANNPEAEAAREKLAYLRSGIQRITFSEPDIEEIKHLRDVAGRRSIQSRWGYKKNSSGKTKLGYPMDVFVTDVSREMPGMEYLADMHPVEAFLAINDLYEDALATAKDKWVSRYLDMPDSEISSMIQSVEELISDAFINEGEKSKYTKYIEGRLEYYKERAEFWKAERDNIKGRDRLLGLLTHKAQQLKDLKKGTFYNATQFKPDLFKDSIEKLSKIVYRGNTIQPKLIRGYFAALSEWYTKDNPMLSRTDKKEGDATDLYNENIAEALKYIGAEERNGFDKAELEMMYEVMSYFVKLIEGYNKVFRNGKWIDAKPVAKKYVELLQSNPMANAGLARTLAFKYDTLFMEPMTVAKRIDNYERGFYTETVEELRNAAKSASIAEMNLRSDYDAFIERNKKYVKTASSEIVKYRGFDIPKMHLISLYMTMKRKHAQAGLALSGFTYSMQTTWWGKHDDVRVPGFITDSKDVTQADIDAGVATQISTIEGLLSATDKEYIALLERMYNQDLRRLKIERDMERLGFSNANLDYYYPIARGNIAKNIDTSSWSDINRATNASFNKDTVKGAKQELVIVNADSLFNKHLHDICKYVYLSGAIENYNILYNMDITDDPNRPISVATESKRVWKDDVDYFKKLITDMQGISRESEGMAVLRGIRGSYVKFQLGANLKVLVTQLSSLFSSTSVLDFGSVIKGMAVSSAGADDYCEYAKLRHYDKTVIKAQGALDKVSKWTDIFTKPISIMDNFVVGKLFGACQVQIQKNGGGKVGTEENKIAAGKLLEKVLLETQQNSMATERSAAMRTGNEIVRSLTMFRSDAMKITGRVIDAYGELAALKKKAKADNNSGTYDADIKKAKKQLTKSVAALVCVSAFMAGVAQLFRWLYNKDDEEETVKTMLVDMGGNIIGGLPLLNDIYEYIANGYELDNFSYSAINDLLSSAVSLGKASIELFDEDDPSMENINRYIKNLSYALGQTFGIPTRNIYNMLYGFTKRFSSTAAYKVDEVFYEQNYASDLEKAIEDGDAKKIELIMSLMFNEALGENISKDVLSELCMLAKDGKNVLPRDIGKKVKRGGAEYELTANQRHVIQDKYSELHKALERLFKTSAYKAADNDRRAEMIAYYDNHYFNTAVNEALGVEDDKEIVYKAVGFDTYAQMYFATQDIAADKDTNGKSISGSKRKKVVTAINKLNVSDGEKLLLITLKGYTLQDGDIANLSATNAEKKLVKYMLSLKLTKSQKLELAEKCGFETKNGTIVLKNGKK